MTAVAAAMILAAGRGERMRPLSDVLPKPALPLVDGPVVASALRLATGVGSGRVVVNTWHLGRLMASAVENAVAPGTAVTLSPESSLMGTAGGLALARDRGLLGSMGSVVVINGDGILSLELGPLVARHTARRHAVTLALLPHPDPSRWSRVSVDDHGLVTAIRPPGEVSPGETSYVYPGVMAVSREALDGLPSTPGEIPDRLWFPALKAGRLGAAMVTGAWREVGTPSDYLGAIQAQLVGRSVTHPTAVVSPTSVIEGSLIGRDARIGDRAVIRRSVVGEGAIVAAGAAVSDSILLGSALAASDEVVDGQVRVGSLQRS